MEVRIDYDTSRRHAILESTDSGPSWLAIRRILIDASTETEAHDLRVELPWWSFLGVREAIRHVLERDEIIFSPSDLATRELVAARDREQQYAEPIPHVEDIQPLLNARGFTRELSENQLHNVARLVSRHAGATFSVPGAGKTTEALAFLFLRAQRGTRLIVIAPKNAFAAWEEQLSLCIPGIDENFVRLTGGLGAIRQKLASGPTFCLITYQQLAVPGVKELLGAFVAASPTFVFVDESHRIKAGVGYAHADAVLALSHVPAGKLILSGTPMPNSITDLIPQFTFLYPELRVTEHNIIRAMTPVFVRTTKRELHLPPVERYAVTVQMSPGQRNLYDLIRSEAARQAAGYLRVADRAQLRRLGSSAIKLLQAASNPALLTNDITLRRDLLTACLAEGDSAKVSAACRRARALAKQGHKCIIWTTFVENVELIARRLADLGADFIHGGVEAGSDEAEDTREYKIRLFHEDPNRMVLVANPAAAGEGISLHTVCHHAIYVDRSFNAAQYVQSEDRIHRFGVDRPTYVEILLAENSIDTVVSRRLDVKVQRMSRVLDDPSLTVEAVPLDLDDEAFDSEDAESLSRFLTS